jgi:hypothetical protein
MNSLRFGLAVVFFAMLSQAQAPTGHIRGRVTDAASALVAGATVRATNIATNVTARTISNSDGNYELRNLIPGTYRVDAERVGFKRYVRDVEVRLGDALTVDIPLVIGAVSDSITVTAETPLLAAATADMGKVVDHRRVMELPGPANGVFFLEALTPGINPYFSPVNIFPPDALAHASGLSVSGSPGASSEFNIDGMSIMSRSGGYTFNPPPEMVQELQVQTNSYDASTGHAIGAQINVVMKSGTNKFHGNLVYQNLSRGMMAHDFFTEKNIYDTSTGPVTPAKIEKFWPPQKTMRYRGSAEGPVYIPHLYNGRNRTFWTFGTDFERRVRAIPGFYTVPTPLQREGNFSALLALGGQYQIYDPATIAAVGNGRFSRAPFPGNLIPSSRIDPMANRLLQYYPLPNTPGNSDGTNNYTDPNVANTPYDAYLGRLDHAFSENHRINGSVRVSKLFVTQNTYFHNQASGNVQDRKQRAFVLSDVVIPRPDLVLNFSYSLVRFLGDRTYQNSRGFDLAALGLPATLVNTLDRSLTTMPPISITGDTALGGTSGSDPWITYHLAKAEAVHTRGNHSLRFGGEFRELLENTYTYGNVSPAYSFGTTWTQGPFDNSAGASIGQGLAALLLGRPSSGSIDRVVSYAEQSKYIAVYFQDDWKLTRKLTVNLGLRYEVDRPSTERYNRANRGFDFATPNPIEAQAKANYAMSPIPEVPVNNFHTLGGLLFAGVDGVPTALTEADNNNFSPRIGIAWQVRPRMVIRSGFGIFFAPLGSDQVAPGQQGFSRTTSMVPSLDNGLTFHASLSNPFPDGVLEPTGAAAGLRTSLGLSPSFVAPTRRNAYMQKWSFAVQQDVGHKTLIEIGYVGSKAIGLGLSQTYDDVPAQYLSTSSERDQTTINYLSQAVANPFYGLSEFAGTGLQTTTVSRSQLLRPYPQFTGVSTTVAGGFSWYHALEASVEKRFSHSYTMQGSYTWSKAMAAVDKLNSTDLYPSRVVSSLDRTHTLSATGIYELPFGRGKRWMASRRWVDLAMGSWAVQGVYQVVSGRPLTWGNVLFRGDVRQITLPGSEQRVERWFNTDGFERNSSKQLASNIRTFPLRLNGVRGGGFNIWNLSITKDFRLSEKVALQFRAEAADAFNHPTFDVPNVSPTSGAFGQVTAIGYGDTARRITLGGRLSW